MVAAVSVALSRGFSDEDEVGPPHRACSDIDRSVTQRSICSLPDGSPPNRGYSQEIQFCTSRNYREERAAGRDRAQECRCGSRSALSGSRGQREGGQGKDRRAGFYPDEDRRLCGCVLSLLWIGPRQDEAHSPCC